MRMVKKWMVKTKIFAQHAWDILVDAGNTFVEDRVMKLSASLAYYTLFSITPLLIIILSTVSLIYEEDAIKGKLFEQLNSLMGPNAAAQIQSFVSNASLSGKSTIALLLGIGSLIVGATAVFVEIQDSINIIWKVKAVPKKGWKKLIINRVLSFSMIVTLGFLMVVTLMINTIVLTMGTKISTFIPFMSDATVYAIKIFNDILTIAVVTGVFAVIFKVLPDVIIKWKIAIIGAIFTTCLFGIGKYAIGLYLEKANVVSIFGSAGSIIVILIWVYYTSIILYFGAELTHAYAERFGDEIKPSKYAVSVITKTIEDPNNEEDKAS